MVQGYDMEAEYWMGKSMQYVDALNRNPVEDLKPASGLGVQNVSIEEEDRCLIVKLQDYITQHVQSRYLSVIVQIWKSLH